MFIAVYEFELKEGTQHQFRQAWLLVTKAIYRHCGSYGSRLHVAENETILIGYAQWPDKQSWQKEHNITDNRYLDGRRIMQSCLIRSKTIYKMEVCDDFLQSGVFRD